MNIHEMIKKNKNFIDLIKDKEEKLEYINTGVIPLNLLHSGKVRGGITKGCIDEISAPSSSGKSFIGLSVLKEAQKIGMQCIVIDSEKAFDYKWADTIGVDTTEEKLTVVSTSDIIAIRQLISVLAEDKTREEKKNVFILLDSWGTLVSPEVLKKSLEGNEAQDMVTPKRKNELANIMKYSDFTFYVINHVYDNTGGFGEPLAVPGGRKLYFNANSVILGQSKKKDTNSQDEVTGTIITAMVHKGRKSVEKSKLQFRIKHDGGLDPWYGLLPDALEHGCVYNEKRAYKRKFMSDDKNWKESQLYCPDFWVPIFKNTDFEDFLNKKYSFEGRKIDISENDFEELMEG